MEEATPSRSQQGTKSRKAAARRGLWPWFAAGFLLIFIGMSFSITMYTMLPSGQGVVAKPLWRYYIVEIGRAIGGPRTLGPASGGTPAVFQTVIQHLLCSLFGGVVMLGLGWATTQFRARRRNAA